MYNFIKKKKQNPRIKTMNLFVTQKLAVSPCCVSRGNCGEAKWNFRELGFSEYDHCEFTNGLDRFGLNPNFKARLKKPIYNSGFGLD